MFHYSLNNNIYFYSQINQNLLLQKIYYLNEMNQRNSIYIYLQNYYTKLYNNLKQDKNLKKYFNTPYHNYQMNGKSIRNFLLAKKEDISEKASDIKIIERRRASIDTTISSNSFNLSSSDEKEYEQSNSKIKVNLLKNPKDNKLNDIPLINQFNENEKNNLLEKEKYKKNLDAKNEEYKGNPIFENTEILRVKVKISKDKIVSFKLKRYDDIFETIKLFCEIYSVNEALIKPIIIRSLSALNTIYQIMNCELKKEQIYLLKNICNI